MNKRHLDRRASALRALPGAHTTRHFLYDLSSNMEYDPNWTTTNRSYKSVLPVRGAMLSEAEHEPQVAAGYVVAGDWGTSHLRLFLCDSAGVSIQRHGSGCRRQRRSFRSNLGRAACAVARTPWRVAGRAVRNGGFKYRLGSGALFAGTDSAGADCPILCFPGTRPRLHRAGTIVSQSVCGRRLYARRGNAGLGRAAPERVLEFRPKNTLPAGHPYQVGALG